MLRELGLCVHGLDCRLPVEHAGKVGDLMGVLLLAEGKVVITPGDFDAEEVTEGPMFLDGSVLPSQVYSQNLSPKSWLIEKVIDQESNYFTLSEFYNVAM